MSKKAVRPLHVWNDGSVLRRLRQRLHISQKELPGLPMQVVDPSAPARYAQRRFHSLAVVHSTHRQPAKEGIVHEFSN